jgi:hypothetical protein
VQWKFCVRETGRKGARNVGVTIGFLSLRNPEQRRWASRGRPCDWENYFQKQIDGKNYQRKNRKNIDLNNRQFDQSREFSKNSAFLAKKKKIIYTTGAGR